LKVPYCRRCGKKLDERDNFCPSCGAPTSLIEAAERVAEEPVSRGSEGRGRVNRSSEEALLSAVWGGVFLAGLGILWCFDFWWPGVLFLIGIMIVVRVFISYVVGRVG
jgi:hypothetical protein